MASPPAPTRVAERLAGKKVLLTGATGFVGQALLRLLLDQVPGLSIVVLVRPKGASSGEDRIRELLGKPLFEAVAEETGGARALLNERIIVLEGDLDDLPVLPADVDAVVHCAGEVSFDPPVDEGFQANVVGTRAILGRVAEIGAHVHYVHISTAYVAGRRRGTVPEGSLDHAVDLEAELSWGLAQRRVVEHRSRGADLLTKTRAKAEKAHGRAGILTAAAAAEDERKTWVRDELVRLGTERARSLGWTDCYTFTKALGERIVEAYAADAPVSIVRPSIIESALETPYPGWIEGFKMAEPVILAYGRGEFPEFPASPDSIVDIVPIDHVVAAIVAVLAHTPEPGRPAWFHLSSGARNPLKFRNLYDIVRRYFERHPFEFGDRGATRLPEWRFPGAQSVERLLTTSERAFKVADYVVTHAPRAERTREAARKLDRQRRRLEFLRRYFDLYLEYAQAELQFSDANTLALYDALDPADREVFAFDTAVIDWDHYLGEVHCPAVTEPIRQLDAARSKRTRSNGSVPPKVSGDDAGRTAAFFDMDGTLLSSNVIESYLWMRLREMHGSERVAELGRITARLPALVRAERRERSAFLRAVYRDYEGARLTDLDAIVDAELASHVLSRLSPEAVRRVREHRAAGQRTILVTGAIRPLTRPLATLFDHIEAADLAVDDDGICTGFLDSSPLVGESRAAWMRHWSGNNDVDLTRSFAYADSHSDLPLLRAVGNPVAVRPDVALYRHAKKNRWPIVDWASSSATTRSLNPAGAPR
jgi:HAD superfamily hydrolase (TIGR01490 family)